MKGPKKDPYGAPQYSSPPSEKTCSSATKHFLFERYDSEHLMTDSLKPIHSLFSKSAAWFNVCESFCRSTKMILLEKSSSIPLKVLYLIDTYKVSHFYPNILTSECLLFSLFS